MPWAVIGDPSNSTAGRTYASTDTPSSRTPWVPEGLVLTPDEIERLEEPYGSHPIAGHQ